MLQRTGTHYRICVLPLSEVAHRIVPAHDRFAGVRKWPKLYTWLADHADESLAAWFGSVEVGWVLTGDVGDATYGRMRHTVRPRPVLFLIY